MKFLWQSVIWSLRGLALTIVLGLSALLLLATWTLHSQKTELLGVQTGSMKPSILVGDLVVTVPRNFTELRVGSVISFRDQQGVVVSHRLRQINTVARTVLTQGDRNSQPDGVVPAARIIGQVQLVLPGLGKITDGLRRPIGLVGVIYVPATLFIVWQLRLLQARLKQPYRLHTSA